VRTREEALKLVGALVADGIIAPRDLVQFAPHHDNPQDPEAVRQDWEQWYRGLGIEEVLDRSFTIDPCPFTAAEIEAAESAGELVLCVPRGVGRRELGELVRLRSWALDDRMVSDTPETEDFWFKTPGAAAPQHLGKSAVEVRRQFEDERKLGFSMERYLVFAARYRHLRGRYPDFRYWTWLLRGRYDRSGMLMVGFDPLGQLSVHAWMPKFQASFLGCRWIEIPDRLADAVEREPVDAVAAEAQVSGSREAAIAGSPAGDGHRSR